MKRLLAAVRRRRSRPHPTLPACCPHIDLNDDFPEETSQ